MTAKIGKRDVLSTQWLLLPLKERGQVSLKEDFFTINIDLYFEDRESEKQHADTKFHEDSNTVEITFINWNSTFGSAIVSPVELAATKDGKKKLSFMIASQRIGTMNSLCIQFLHEEVSE